MNKMLLIVIGMLAAGVILFYALNSYIYNEKQGDAVMQPSEIQIMPVSHATMVMAWGDVVLYTDPVGAASAFAGKPQPDIILLTDTHGDHLSTSTLQSVAAGDTVIIAPQAVADRLPAEQPGSIVVLKNGETTNQKGLAIQAIPMYNLPEAADSYHTKGRGNGYVVEGGGRRVYVSGDTADIPEMRSLRDIDIAFVSMNLPYTMSIESAASAVLEFKPLQVYPYHYRGPEGLSDINKFKSLVNAGDPNINVVLMDWYPEP